LFWQRTQPRERYCVRSLIPKERQYSAGVRREEAEVYEEGVRRGSTLVAVQADETDIPKVEAILDRRPSRDWREHREEYSSSGWQPTR
jgi:hypothetical protein